MSRVEPLPPRLSFPRLPLVMVNIIGTMGSGKTTLAFRLWRRFKWQLLNRYIGNIYFQYDRNKIDEFWEAVRNFKKERCFVVVDDISFALSLKDRIFLHQLSRIRHMNPRVRRWVVVTVMHYGRATLPFLRQAHIKVLTSLTDPEEIEQLKWAFTTTALWDYYYLYTDCPTCHWILLNWLGKIGVSRFYKPKKNKCWDIVVNGPECLE